MFNDNELIDMIRDMIDRAADDCELTRRETPDPKPNEILIDAGDDTTIIITIRVVHN